MGCSCDACAGVDYSDAAHNVVGRRYAAQKCAPALATWSPEEEDPIYEPYGCEPPKAKRRRVTSAPFVSRGENASPPPPEHWPSSPPFDAQYKEPADV